MNLHRAFAAGMRAAAGGGPLTFIFNIASDNETLTIPCQDVGTFNATLDWGDGSTSEITTYDDADLSHTYTTAGEYSVTVAGDFPNVYFNRTGDKAKLIGMLGGEQHEWLALNLAFFETNLAVLPDVIYAPTATSFASCFRSTNITAIPAGLFDNNAAVTSFDACFMSCSGLTAIPTGLFDNNTAVTSFRYCFFGCANITDFPASAFDNWNPAATSNDCFVNTWGGCSSLTAQSVINILTSIDTSGVSAPASGVDITIDYAGGDISAAATAITNLKGRGWTVTINGVAQ